MWFEIIAKEPFFGIVDHKYGIGWTVFGEDKPNSLGSKARVIGTSVPTIDNSRMATTWRRVGVIIPRGEKNIGTQRLATKES